VVELGMAGAKLGLAGAAVGCEEVEVSIDFAASGEKGELTTTTCTFEVPACHEGVPCGEKGELTTTTFTFGVPTCKDEAPCGEMAELTFEVPCQEGAMCNPVAVKVTEASGEASDEGEGRGRRQAQKGAEAQISVGKGKGASRGTRSERDSELQRESERESGPGSGAMVSPIADSLEEQSAPGGASGVASGAGGCEGGQRQPGRHPGRPYDPDTDPIALAQEDSSCPSGEGGGRGRTSIPVVATPPRAKCVEDSPLGTPRQFKFDIMDDDQAEGARTPSIYGDGAYLGWSFPGGCGDGSGGGPGLGPAELAAHGLVDKAQVLLERAQATQALVGESGSDIKTSIGEGAGETEASPAGAAEAGIGGGVGAYGGVSKKARKRARQRQQTEDTFRRAWGTLPADLKDRVCNGELDVVQAIDLLVARF